MPGCSTCSQSYPSSTGYIPNSCSTVTPCAMDSACVVYGGANLSCTGINTGDTLDIILEKIDPLICSSGGDYSSFNTYCLAPINTLQEFVEGISQFACDTNATVNNFINNTFVAYQESIATQILAITSINITCTSAGVIPSDSLTALLNKYCTKFASIDTLINPSSANWNACYVVSPNPTTITEGFNVLIAQICLLKSTVASAATLPVFNNLGSCLDTPGAADTLVATVNKIKTRLCQTGTLDNSSLTWGCVAQPAGAQDLQSAIQNILTVVTATAKIVPTSFSGDFVVTNVDNGNLCLGKQVALAVPSSADRFVASTASDATPGTLQDKLVAGTNVTLDYVTIPGKTIVNAAGGGGGGTLVLADATDSTPGYLIDKVLGSSSMGITVTPTLDVSDPLDHKVTFQLTVNAADLFMSLISVISTDSEVKTAFCAAVASCPSPCSAPSNVTVTYSPGTTSTSTTTTTTP